MEEDGAWVQEIATCGAVIETGWLGLDYFLETFRGLYDIVHENRWVSVRRLSGLSFS